MNGGSGHWESSPAMAGLTTVTAAPRSTMAASSYLPSSLTLAILLMSSKPAPRNIRHASSSSSGRFDLTSPWLSPVGGNLTTTSTATTTIITTTSTALPSSAFFWSSPPGPTPAAALDMDDQSGLAKGHQNILVALVLGTIMVFTIVGNIMVIYAIFNYRPLHNVQNMFMVSLAVADIAVAVLVMPLNVAYSILERWIFGLHICEMWLTSDVLCCTASILNLCAIALDRYQAIHDPINYAQKRTMRRVCSSIAIVWILSAIISIPPLIGWNDWPAEFNEETPCKLSEERSYIIYSASGSFFIPLLIMTVVYFKIFQATRRRLKDRAKASGTMATVATATTATATTANHNVTKVSSGEDSSSSTSPTTKSRYLRCGCCGHGPAGSHHRHKEHAARPKGHQKLLRFNRKMLHHETTIEMESASEEHSRNDFSSSEAGGITSGAPVTQHRDSAATDGDGGSGNGELCPPPNGNTEPRTTKSASLPSSTGGGGGGSSLNHHHQQQQADDVVVGGPAAATPPPSPPLPPSPPPRKEPLATTLVVDDGGPGGAGGAGHHNQPSSATTLIVASTKVTAAAPGLPPTPGVSVKKIWEEKQKISLSRERRATRILGIIMGVFVACWLPFFLMYVIVPFCESCSLSRETVNFITWLGYMNSALNPLIYCGFNRDFRRAFQKILCCKKV